MRDPRAEGGRWLSQAENDLALTRHVRDGGFFHQACFSAQQCAEKALKAVLYAGGARNVLGHSVVGLLNELASAHPELQALRDQAAELDLFYIPTRYPNGLAAGTPHETFTRSQADRALAAAEAFVAAVKRILAASDGE